MALPALALLLIAAALMALRAETPDNESRYPTPLAATTDKPLVVATTAHIADIVQNLAANHVRLETLIKTGVDPHLYRPVRSDIVKLGKADLILYNGRHLEGRMTELLEQMSQTRPAIALADHAKTALNGDDGAYDPHIWMDAENWIAATQATAGALIALLPDHKDEIANNALAYTQQLMQLDQAIHQSISAIPAARRTLITAHDAFGYYGDAYGIEVIGVQGLSTASEAGLQKIESLVALIIARDIPAIFAETSVSDQNIKAIVEGVRHKGHALALGDMLYSDSLGNAGTPQSTYIGMMTHNTGAIARALSAASAVQTQNTAPAAAPNNKPVNNNATN